MKMTGGDAILRSLEAEGVEVMFGIPGGAIMPTYDAMARGTAVRHVLARHEQGAGHMAQGYARASGRVGVAIATRAPLDCNALLRGMTEAICGALTVMEAAGLVSTLFSFASTCCFCCSAFICGPATKYCQPKSTAAESTTAIRRFLLSMSLYFSGGTGSKPSDPPSQ